MSLIHPKGVQDHIKIPHQTPSSTFLWTLICSMPHSRVGTGRGHQQTLPTTSGPRNCQKHVGTMKDQEFLSLEVRGRAQLLEPNTITIKRLIELVWELSELRIPPLNVLGIVSEHSKG